MKRVHKFKASFVAWSFGIIGGVAFAMAATPSCESSSDTLTISSSGGEAGQAGAAGIGGADGTGGTSGEGGGEKGGNGSEVGGNAGEGAAGGSSAKAGGAGSGGDAGGGGMAGTGGVAGTGGLGGNEGTCPSGFVLIPAGDFMMGSPMTEKGRYGDETEHKVTLTRAFCMQETEVTQQQYKNVMQRNPASFSGCGDNCPAEKVSWHMAAAYCNKLSEKAGLDNCYDRREGKYSPIQGTPYDCKGYRLPTEAEWEYAARADSTTAFYNGDITYENCNKDPNLDKIGWYCWNAKNTPHPVKDKEKNEWGLYDMSGNVWEWCHDYYQELIESTQEIDPVGPENGTKRVIRGGSWKKDARECRSAKRTNTTLNTKYNDLGFRPVVAPRK